MIVMNLHTASWVVSFIACYLFGNNGNNNDAAAAEANDQAILEMIRDQDIELVKKIGGGLVCLYKYL